MTRVSAFLFTVLMLFVICVPGGIAESDVPEGAVNLISLFVSCPDAATFDGMPSPELGYEAVCAYRRYKPDTVKTDEEIYGMLFTEGVLARPESYIPALNEYTFTVEELPCAEEGLFAYSVTAYDGWDFVWCADVYLESCESNLFKYKLRRVFFPE